MNVAAMLGQSVTPLAAYQPQSAPAVRPKEWKRNTTAANQAKKATAIARYKAVMTKEWTLTREIEDRLGTGRSCCIKTLEQWRADRLLEKRMVGKTNLQGWEWRWK